MTHQALVSVTRASGNQRILEPSWFFSDLLEEIQQEEIADVEPSPRFTPGWERWQLRHFRRMGRAAEVREAQALTTFADDPAPLACEGLGEFLGWCRRQKERGR